MSLDAWHLVLTMRNETICRKLLARLSNEATQVQHPSLSDEHFTPILLLTYLQRLNTQNRALSRGLVLEISERDDTVCIVGSGASLLLTRSKEKIVTALSIKY